VTGLGREVAGRYDCLPFGEDIYEWRAGYGGDPVGQRFTGYERDAEKNSDYVLHESILINETLSEKDKVISRP